MQIGEPDRAILRDLAKRVAEIAALDIQAERRQMWKQHNSLHRVRPMVLVFPEGAWRELLPDDALRCEGKDARRVEWQLRSRIYQHEHLHDDMVIEAEWFVDAVIRGDGWGLEPAWRQTDNPTGAKGFDPVINSPADLKKLRFPEYTYDKDATDHLEAGCRELFGDILQIKRRGVRRLGFSLMRLYSDRRGLGQAMLDMSRHQTNVVALGVIPKVVDNPVGVCYRKKRSARRATRRMQEDRRWTGIPSLT